MKVDGRRSLLVADTDGVQSLNLRNTDRKNNQLLALDKPETLSTSLSPLDANVLFVSDGGCPSSKNVTDATARGNITKQRLGALLTGARLDEVQLSVDRCDSPVTASRAYTFESAKYYAAGDEDGIVRVWTAE